MPTFCLYFGRHFKSQLFGNLKLFHHLNYPHLYFLLPGHITKIFGQFHFDGTTTGDDSIVLDGPTNDHDSVVQRSLRLFHELLGSSTKDQGAGLTLGHAGEEVETFTSDLELNEKVCRSLYLTNSKVPTLVKRY